MFLDDNEEVAASEAETIPMTEDTAADAGDQETPVSEDTAEGAEAPEEVA